MKNGRIDFLHPVEKNWGVGQHVQTRRLSEGEYGKQIEEGWMSDYIIIDFRTRHSIVRRGKTSLPMSVQLTLNRRRQAYLCRIC